jgi:hypothetical protein
MRSLPFDETHGASFQDFPELEKKDAINEGAPGPDL